MPGSHGPPDQEGVAATMHEVMHVARRGGRGHLLAGVGERLHARLDRVNREHEGVLQGAGHRPRQHVLRPMHKVSLKRCASNSHRIVLMVLEAFHSTLWAALTLLKCTSVASCTSSWPQPMEGPQHGP